MRHQAYNLPFRSSHRSPTGLSSVLKSSIGLCFCCILFSVSLYADDGTQSDGANPSPESILFFESKIRPLLIQRCVECHSDSNRESGLSLESRSGILRGGKLGPAVVPGKPKESLLISAVNHDEFLKMPPKDKLATAELAFLTKWVAMGAPWPEPASDAKGSKRNEDAGSESMEKSEKFTPTEDQKNYWSFQPLKRPVVPKLDSNDWIRSPIDSFVLERLQAQGLTPSSSATKRDLIRRATYDLTGLPPTESEIEEFLNDRSTDAFGTVIERLLASPRYGEKWGRHWLDVARFAESNGLDENIAYANAFRYRDYVISSFNSDKPYDRFVQEQIAGDLLEPSSSNERDSLDRFVATGFLAIGAKMLAEDDPLKMQMDIIDEQLNTLCQAFMGITIGCARCHDHKFDPIPTTDYYALAGIFKSTKTMENHKVVAKWFERPLVTASELEQIQSIDREIETAKEGLDSHNKVVLSRVSKEIRSSIAKALLSSAQLERFETRAKESLGKGIRLDEGPYPVNAGYALIEAEGFQRGNTLRDSEQYGKEIGVILSKGEKKEVSHAEFDILVQEEGRYAIELRYAAAERRPIRILINETEVTSTAASDVTGSWQPDSQTWAVGGFVNLKAGKHVLRFESKKVFPHIDKFALVYQSDKGWPFGEEPVALSLSGRDFGLSYPIVALWKSYLDKGKKREGDTSTKESFFELWHRLRNTHSDFASASKRICEELEQDSPLRHATPSPLRDALLAHPPESLDQVADAYQVAIQRILSSDAKDDKEGIGKLREELVAKGSPLAGIKNDVERFYTSDERVKATELTDALASIERRKPKPPMAMGTTDAKVEDLKVHLRGSHVVLGKLVSRRFPQFLAGEKQTPLPESKSGRLELAQWVTQKDHPLTSRVLANRVWHWHFGSGIVPSVDNFGLLGQKPTHPELLDWLACELVENDWSIKQLHRIIMNSQTYQMSTRFDSVAAEKDPENQLHWRFQRRRLTAEETRDSVVSIGTGLDNKMYGSLMKVENHSYVNSTGGSSTLDYTNARRTVYLPVIRSGVYDVIQTLDFPDPAMINGSRQTSTVAPQALLMMNSDLVHEQSLAIAERLIPASSDDEQRIHFAYHRILQRAPSPEESAAAASFLLNLRNKVPKAPASSKETAEPPREILVWQGLCRVLISSNEFSYLE